MLEQFSDSVFTVTRDAKFFGVECGSRMTVVKLSDGGLFVHSPVALDAKTRLAVDLLGEVRAVVAPSVFHHLHVKAWMDAYPKAHFAACPGLEWKRPDLPFNSVLGDVPHSIWASDIAQIYFSARRENEVVFYVPKERLMICADALINLSNHRLRSTRFVAKVIGNKAPGVGWLEPLMIRDRRIARRQVDRILGWSFDRAIVSHGDLIMTNAEAAVRHAYAWL